MPPLDPNAAASPDSGIFGLDFTEAQARLIYIPVPWDATTSYRDGTALGPRAILKASHQMDLFDLEVERPYEAGLHLLKESSAIRALNKQARLAALPIIRAGGVIGKNKALAARLKKVNQLSAKMNQFVHQSTKKIISAGKIPAVIGGDHSTPYGAIEAAVQAHPGMGILHFDAHLDLRKAYEGFEWSHASIMRNVMDRLPAVHKLVQVGIRDFCEEEYDFVREHDSRIQVHYDTDLQRRKHSGTPWEQLAQDMIYSLPNDVWVSLDIDGLDPRFCPNTGTPVPGGLDFHEVNGVLRQLVASGRRVIGFDLNEVAPPKGFPRTTDEWDANVGMRLLYKLTAWTLASQKICVLR